MSLGPLMLASTFVLVGDHYQLPPLVQVHIFVLPLVFGVENFQYCFHLHVILTDMGHIVTVQSTEARENGMGISLFCRLSEAHPQAISALQCQVSLSLNPPPPNVRVHVWLYSVCVI